MDESPFDWQVLLLLAVVLISFIGTHITHTHHIEWIPEGGLTILFGVLIGGADFALGGSMKDVVTLNATFFSTFMLPPIIFDAGFSLNRKSMFSDLGTILLYAVVGTLISALMIGFSCFLYLRTFPEYDYEHLSTECLLFGSLISATDPVASLAVYSAVFHVSEKPQAPLVYNLVFGESVLNDAVAIVLFKSFLTLVDEPFDGPTSIAQIVGQMLAVSSASVAIGFGTAVLTALLFKHTRLRENNVYEIFLVFLMSYGAYILAEALGFSGIFAIFICGIFQAHYTARNLSSIGRLVLPKIFNALAHVAETLVFAYLGMAFFAFSDSHQWDLSFICFTIALCLGVRAVPVFTLSNLANWKRKYKIDFRRQIIIWFAGLRGAIAFVLAIELRSEGDLQNGSMLLSTTLGVVMFTTIVCGVMTRPLLRCLHLDTEEEPMRLPARKVRRFDKFDEKYVVPFLCRQAAPALNDTHPMLETSASNVGRRGFLFGVLAKHSDWSGAANLDTGLDYSRPVTSSGGGKSVVKTTLPGQTQKFPGSDSGLDLSYQSVLQPPETTSHSDSFLASPSNSNLGGTHSPLISSASPFHPVKYGQKGPTDPALQSKLLDEE